LYHLTFGLIEPFDIPCLQQMVQETVFSTLHFNAFSPTILVAKCDRNIVGFTVGHKGDGDKSHVVMIRGTYLRHFLDDPCHENELQMAFTNWAKENLGVTHYAFDDFDDPKPICILHMLPQPTSEVALEIDDVGMTSQPAYEIF
jgi:hypothetical protein